VSADWLNGIGLVCNIVGVLGLYFFGVPRYPTVEDAGRSALLLAGGPDPAEREKVIRALWLSRAGLAVLGVGFALQLAALLAY